MPIVGHDDKNVFVHNSRVTDGQEFMMIHKDTFDKARKANGTDEDVIVIEKA